MFEEFKNKYIGKAVDVDNAYGPQCVDLFNAFNRDYNNVYINCSPTGYAHSIAENKKNNGILNYYHETAVNNMITGTVIVYGKCPFAPESHICFFIKDNGNGTYQALQQNAAGKPYVTIDNNPYDGIIGAFIPNQIQEEFNRESGDKKPQPDPSIQYLNLNGTINAWNVYPMNVAPIKGNEVAKLNPAKFGGLSYTIKGYTKENVAIIETSQFGQVQIYIGAGTEGKYSITDSPVYSLIK